MGLLCYRDSLVNVDELNSNVSIVTISLLMKHANMHTG